MVYIPFIYFIVLLLVNFIRVKGFNLGNLLLTLYAFSALLSIFLYNVEFLHYKNIEVTLASTLFYCGALTVFFFPFLSNSQSRGYKILLPDDKVFTYVSVFLIAVNVIAILLLLKTIIFILGYDPKSLRDATLKNVYASGRFESMGMWLLGHFSDFYLVLLVFFFYSVTYLKKGFFFNALLLVASLSTIVNGLLSGGRTQIFYWLFVFASAYLYFRGDMPRRLRKWLVFFSLLLFCLVSVYIYTVTVSRFEGAFSGETDFDEAFSLLDYSGQIFLNFSNFFSNFEHKSHTLARIFPFINSWVTGANFDFATYKSSIYMDVGVFSTFLGDWLIDIGITGILIYTVVYSIASFFVTKDYTPGARKLQHILLYFMVFQIPLNGLFYYSLHNKTAIISVYGTIIIALLFRFAEKETIEVAKKPL